jgi:hypothetical protein
MSFLRWFPPKRAITSWISHKLPPNTYPAYRFRSDEAVERRKGRPLRRSTSSNDDLPHENAPAASWPSPIDTL